MGKRNHDDTRDTRYLLERGKSWSVKVTIPPSLRPAHNNATHVIRALKTKNLSVAQHRRHAAVASIKEQFRNEKAQAANSVADQLQEIESKWQEKRRVDRFGFPLPMTAKEKEEYAKDVARARELGDQRLAETLGMPAPSGRPIGYMEKQFFAERKITPRTQGHYKKCLRSLEGFLQQEGLPVTLESVTRPVALAYQSWLVAEEYHHVTGSALIAGLRSRFNFLLAKMAIEGGNPFQGLALKGANTGEEDSRRPWSGPELKRLFSAECDLELYDLMAAGLLLGARRAEIVGFKVKDYRGGWLYVRTAKSKAGVRKIPCPRVLRLRIRELIEGRAPNDYIFLQTKSDVAIHTRGNICGQRFERFRKSIGLDSDATVYHSFRWTYMSLADQSRPRHHVKTVVGHSDKKDVTSSYTKVSDRNRVRVMQAVVKALPVEVRNAISARFGRSRSFGP